MEDLRDQVAYLRDQLDQEREANRENRRIIAGLVQRAPELEAPQEPRDSSGRPETAAAGGASGGQRSRTPGGPETAVRRRSWLMRFFGFE